MFFKLKNLCQTTFAVFKMNDDNFHFHYNQFSGIENGSLYSLKDITSEFFFYFRNSILFTPTQIEAIKSGMHPGLTMVVGPPGTGKTDVAVQIISNIYHNFPDQRTLIVTHSNQVGLFDCYGTLIESSGLMFGIYLQGQLLTIESCFHFRFKYKSYIISNVC